jgi:predicted DNA-binding transcriptional regulator AlpA
MAQDKGPFGFVPLTPVLVDAKTASRLCGVGLSLWYELSAAGRTPQSVKLNSKSLWPYGLLKLWAEHGCPSRESAEWQGVLAKTRGGKEAE